MNVSIFKAALSRCYRILMAVMCVACVATSIDAQERVASDLWADWRFLMGAWDTDSGATNAGSGSFTLLPELQGSVLIRKNHAEYPSVNGRPASVHDDLMVIHRDTAGNVVAHYYDSEGHAISYEVTIAATKDTITLVSAPQTNGPRFRLTYAKGPEGRVGILFAIAPPGHPESFSPYLQGTAHRKPNPGR